MRKSIAVLFGLLCAGCAGRSPQPVAIVQAQDRYMDCAAILIEVQANNEKVRELAGDQGTKTAQNVAAGVAGIFIPILWFGMDFQGTADKEVAALNSRQQYLGVLAEQRNCGAEQAPAPKAAAPKSASKRNAAPPPQ